MNGDDRNPLSLASWSLHVMYDRGELDQLGMVRFAAEHGFSGFELGNRYFRAPTQSYLQELRGIAESLGVRLLLIMCNDEGDVADANRAERMQAARNHRKWVDVAAFLGCHSIRVNVAQNRPPGEADDAREAAAEALSELLAYAAGELRIVIENHGGLSSDPDWVVSLLEQVGDPGLGTLPDFGGFPPERRYEGVEKFMPYATAVSAKCYDFGPDGEETTIDFARMLRLVRAAGYRGHIGVESEGERLSERDGVLAAKALLERTQAGG
jgi:sugar phosphate isomerase/epimerase